MKIYGMTKEAEEILRTTPPKGGFMADQKVFEDKRLLQLSLYLKVMFDDLGQAPGEDELVQLFVADVERLAALAQASVEQEKVIR